MDLSNIKVNSQSSIRIEGSRVLYFDPFEINEVSADADYIFITHDHYDHFDCASIARIKKADTCLVAPESIRKNILSEAGIPAEKCVFYQPGTVNELDGLMVQTVPAYNKIKPFHMKSCKWQGYIVEMDGVKYYVAGDTDANEDVKAVRCDVALIPIGGYYTMDKKQAAELILTIAPKAAIPTHYGKHVGSDKDGEDFMKLVAAKSADIQLELRL